MSEDTSQPKSFFKRVFDFVTDPNWGPFKNFLGVAVIFLGLAAWIFVDVPALFGIADRDLSLQKDNSSTEAPIASEALEIENSSPTSDVSSSIIDLERTRQEAATSIEDSNTIIKKIIKENNQFDYFNGSAPRNNFEVFLEKYYGLNGNPKLGDGLLRSMLDKEVEWSVKVQHIMPTDEGAALILVGVNNPVCESEECPEGFIDNTYIEFREIEGMPTTLKKGDFIHVRGTLIEHPDKETSPKLRYRAHIHWEKITYYDPQKTD